MTAPRAHYYPPDGYRAETGAPATEGGAVAGGRIGAGGMCGCQW